MPESLKPEDLKVDPFGVLVGHTWAEVGIILKYINVMGIKRFVEIGVHAGGLCALLVHTTKHIPGFKYLGVEIDRNLVEPTVRKLFDPLAQASLMIADAHHPNTIQRVKTWINEDSGPAWIYCDGGDKPKEFALYAPILRKNDFIAAHDFDYGGYERAEIKPEDVTFILAEEGLSPIGFAKPYRIALFKKVLE